MDELEAAGRAHSLNAAHVSALIAATAGCWKTTSPPLVAVNREPSESDRSSTASLRCQS